MPRYLGPVRDATIVRALHHVRAHLVREGQDGLEHVDALLRLYGVDPATLRIPRKRPHHYRRGGLRRAIMDALRGGPLTVAELAAKVGNGLPPDAAYKRTGRARCGMKVAGTVTHEGRLWGLPGVR